MKRNSRPLLNTLLRDGHRSNISRVRSSTRIITPVGAYFRHRFAGYVDSRSGPDLVISKLSLCFLEANSLHPLGILSSIVIGNRVIFQIFQKHPTMKENVNWINKGGSNEPRVSLDRFPSGETVTGLVSRVTRISH